MNYIVYTDGGSRGNPGPSAIGFVIYNDKNLKVFSSSKYLGTTTNNIAEYVALYLAILKVKELKDVEHVQFYLDSELVVKQMKGDYKIINQDLKTIYDKIKNELKNMDYSIQHIKRERNKEADFLVNKVLDSNMMR